MEEEADDSLIALTTHFAQVQFRLKQVISADHGQKEALLKDLEEFAFQGCAKAMSYDTAAAGENGSLEYQRERRSEMMVRLRTQLDELEQCAHEVTDSGSLAEKQQIIIDELKKRFDLHFGDLEHLSREEVKEKVDRAVHEIVDPIKSKDELVSQLHTQVKDLERYITFLQATQLPSTPPCTTPVRSKHVRFADDSKPPDEPHQQRHLVGPVLDRDNQPVPRYSLSLTQLDGVKCSVDTTMAEWEKTDRQPLYETQPTDDMGVGLLLVRKTLAVMKLLTLWQCGGSFHCLPRYVADGKRKRYHAALHSMEQTVDKIAVITTALTEPGVTSEACVSLETDLHEAVSMSLADSLRVLLEHGLLEGGEPVLWEGGCFPVWRRRMAVSEERDCAAWKVFKHYFNVKKGKEYNTKPEQLLSSSFAIPLDTNTSIKKTLLSTVHRVEHSYAACQHRAKDTKFRALICEGYNLCHLSEWFRIVATHPSIAEDLYSTTSFLATTGFRPALACLERLKDNPVSLPVQLPPEIYQCTDAF